MCIVPLTVVDTLASGRVTPLTLLYPLRLRAVFSVVSSGASTGKATRRAHPTHKLTAKMSPPRSMLGLCHNLASVAVYKSSCEHYFVCFAPAGLSRHRGSLGLPRLHTSGGPHTSRPVRCALAHARPGLPASPPAHAPCCALRARSSRDHLPTAPLRHHTAHTGHFAWRKHRRRLAECV